MATHDEPTIREALSRLIASAWHQTSRERPKACFSIPADPERDEARGKALEEAARAINNWPHVAGMVRALAAKGGA